MIKPLLSLVALTISLTAFSQKKSTPAAPAPVQQPVKSSIRKVPFDQLVNINDVYYYNNVPYSGISIELFPDKSKMQELQWKNGLLHGTKTEYFKGGVAIRAILHFTEGKRNGYFKFYHQNGQLKLCGKYVDDLLDSTVNAFYDNGNPKYISEYKMGVKTGTSLTYFSNGNLEQKVNLVNELPDGVMESYYEAGNIRLRTTYKQGIRDGLFLRYHLNGTVAEESYFKNGIQDSVSYYWDNVFGSIMKIQNYKMGKKDGIWVTFNEIGDTLSKYTYEDDVFNGPYSIYVSKKIDHEKGVDGKGHKIYDSEYVHALEEFGTYKNGKLDGVFKSGLYNKEKHVEGFYKEGVMVGEWRYYNADGKMVLYELYDDNGTLLKQKPKLKKPEPAEEEEE